MDQDEPRLEEINRRSLPGRILGYARLTGPGYLQSAMTLGSGTAAACLLSGWYLGYKLLWVQPAAMLLGVIVFAAIAKQTLNSDDRPYEAFWNRLHPLMALAWGLSALFASIFWNIPQYAIAVSSVADLGEQFGVKAADLTLVTGIAGSIEGAFAVEAVDPVLVLKWLIGLAILAVCIVLSWSYGKEGRTVRVCQKAVRVIGWAMVLAMAGAFVAGGGVFGIAFAVVFLSLLAVSGEGEQPTRYVRGILWIVATALAVAPLFVSIVIEETSVAGAGLWPWIAIVALLLLRGLLRRDPSASIYEIFIKITVWGMVFAFAWVAVATEIQWGELLKGLFGFHIPSPVSNSKGFWYMLGGLSAAVGINMVFLYPYSLRQRNWGKHHEGLAQYDLLSGMFLPFAIASVFVIIATANTIGPGAANHMTEQPRSMVHLIPVLSETLGKNAAAILLGLGLFAMGLSSITVQMVAAGFTATEMFGLKHGGWGHRICMLLPAPVGILGSVTLKPLELAVYVSAGMVVFLPLAYIGFLILNNKSSYLGEAMPRAGRRWIWNIGLTLAITVVTVASVMATYNKVREHFKKKAEAEKKTALIESAPRAASAMHVIPGVPKPM